MRFDTLSKRALFHLELFETLVILGIFFMIHCILMYILLRERFQYYCSLIVLIIFLTQAYSFSFVDTKPWPFNLECTTLPDIDTSNDSGTPGTHLTETATPFFLHSICICLATFLAYGAKPQEVPWLKTIDVT